MDFVALQQHDPDAAASLRSVLSLPRSQYVQLLQLEQLPSGMRRQQYVQHAVQQLLVSGVAWQLQALRAGFSAASDVEVLSMCRLDGASLSAALCGCGAEGPSAAFRVQKVFRVVLEDAGSYSSAAGGCDGCSTQLLLVDCLWQVLDRWGEGQRLAFVKFVTGIARCAFGMHAAEAAA